MCLWSRDEVQMDQSIAGIIEDFDPIAAHGARDDVRIGVIRIGVA